RTTSPGRRKPNTAGDRRYGGCIRSSPGEPRRTCAYNSDHIAVRIQRGGGIWPCETPATSRKGKVPIPSGSNYKGLGDVERAVSQPPTTDPGGGFFIYAARVASL